MPVFHAAHVCSPAMRDLSQMFNSLIEHLDQFIVFRRGWPLLMMSSLMSLVDHSVSTNPRLSFAGGTSLSHEIWMLHSILCFCRSTEMRFLPTLMFSFLARSCERMGGLTPSITRFAWFGSLVLLKV